MTNTATQSLIKALACNEETSHTDEAVAQVATQWFAHWLEVRATLEIAEGRESDAESLIRASYALKNLE